MNLGSAFSYRVTGGMVENLEQAERHYRNALQALTPENAPLDWAKAQAGLCEIYQQLTDWPQDSIEQALQRGHAALEVLTREMSPVWWARVRRHLGTAYANRRNSHDEQDIERAIEALSDASTVLTRDLYPEEHTLLQSALAGLFMRRTLGDPEENRRLALAYAQGTQTSLSP